MRNGKEPSDGKREAASVEKLLAGDDVLRSQRAEQIVADPVGEVIVFLRAGGL
jgi:hypothetical protein